jgi:hypothetical protein
MCPKGELDMWHKKDCLTGNCVLCGVERKLKFCPLELDPESPHLVKWRRYERIDTGARDADGRAIRRMREVYKETAPFELLQHLKPTLQHYIHHNFVATWQDTQAKLAMKSLAEGVILSHIDFVENYDFKVRNEIQSEYYESITVTILVHITYRVQVDRESGENRVIKEGHFYISDDKSHDTFFVQHCLIEHWKWLADRGFKPREYIVFSDGASSQFKNCRGLYFVARYPGITEGCQMRYEFFGIGHGKGKPSGALVFSCTSFLNSEFHQRCI